MKNINLDVVTYPKEDQFQIEGTVCKEWKKNKISLLLPSRDNVEGLDVFMSSLVKHTRQLKNIEVILYVDADDEKTKHYKNEAVNIVKITGPRLTMGQYNSVCYRYSSGGIIMLMNDDVVIETKNWDAEIKQKLSVIDDEIYLAYPNDGFMSEKLCTFPILSRKTCELLCYPYPGLYRRLFIDTHLMDVFARLKHQAKDRTIYFNDVIFQHRKNTVLDVSGSQRNECFDDLIFMQLIGLRNQQADCLDNAIKHKPGTIIKKDIEISDRLNEKNILKYFMFFISTFLFDRRLGIVKRTSYFLWFSGHFFMVKTLPGSMIFKIISILKNKS